jgi:MFS superfamily sulfate permease-like transporter
LRFRLSRLWSGYLRGVRERYALLTTPAHPGFFLAWFGYAVFVAATLRWFIDLLLLAVLVWRRCETPSIPRLEHETRWIPIVMLAGVAVMALTLLSKQRGYARAIPGWIAEALVTLAPIAVVLALAGLAFFWSDLGAACG